MKAPKTFHYLNAIFETLLLKSPKLAEELLHEGIESNSPEDCVKIDSSTYLALDFGLFDTRKARPNSSTIQCMLQEGHRDLIKHPLSESFLHLKWQKLCWAFYAALTYRLILAFVVTLSSLAEVSRHPLLVQWAPVTRPGLTWLLVAVYIPTLLQLIFDLCYQKLAFFSVSWVRLQCLALPLPSLSSLVQIGLLATILSFVILIITTQNQAVVALTHCSAWCVLLAWTFFLLKVREKLSMMAFLLIGIN